MSADAREAQQDAYPIQYTDRAPGVGELAGVEECEGDAGEDRAKDEGCGGVQGAVLPAFEASGCAVEGEPVVGCGEGRQKEAAKGDLFDEWSKEDGESAREPSLPWGSEQVIDQDLVWMWEERFNPSRQDGQ